MKYDTKSTHVLERIFSSDQQNNIMLKICLLIALSVCMAVAIPTPQEYDYEEEAVCLTSADSMDPEKECVFPFTANGTTYHGCPMDFTGDKTKRWCSTKTDENGEHIAGINAWGYCTKGCKPEISPGTKYAYLHFVNNSLIKQY